MKLAEDCEIEINQGDVILILGRRGSGKSNTANLIYKELWKDGQRLICFDYKNDHFDLPGRHINLKAKPVAWERVLASSDSYVFEMRGLPDHVKQDHIKHYLEALNNSNQELWTMIEEVHTYAPLQPKRGSSGEKIRRLAKVGRSQKQGLIAVTQKTAHLDKTVSDEADITIMHKMTGKNDLDAVHDQLGYLFSNPKELTREIPHLDTGEAAIIDRSAAEMRKCQVDLSIGVTVEGFDTMDYQTINTEKNVEGDTMEEKWKDRLATGVVVAVIVVVTMVVLGAIASAQDAAAAPAE